MFCLWYYKLIIKIKKRCRGKDMPYQPFGFKLNHDQ